MRALVYHGPRDVRCDSVPEPALAGPGDVLIQVELAGICGSDLHVYEAREQPDPGTVLGHELVGRVLEAGRDVGRFRAGDRVLAPFTTSCGACFYCARGLTARCTHGQLLGWVENGRGLPGAQAERVRVPLADSTLRRVPDGVGPEEALLLADTLATGWHCARMAEVAGGQVHVVLGCGAVGLMAVAAAFAQGAERVFAVDAVPERLAVAERFGAETLRLGAVDPLDAVREATGGRGADGVLEAVGSAEATRLAYALVRPGGVIAAAGVHHEREFGFSPGLAYDKNLTYRAGRCSARVAMEEALPLVESRRHDLAAVFTHRAGLEDGADAYARFAARRDGCIKVAVRPGE